MMNYVLTRKDTDKKFDAFGIALFKYLDQRFAENDQKLEKLESSINRLTLTTVSFEICFY